MTGDLPPGLAPRRTAVVMAEPAVDREAAIAALLTVQPPGLARTGFPAWAAASARTTGGGSSRHAWSLATRSPSSERRGRSRRWRTRPRADALEGSLDPLGALEDPAIAADIAEALAAGTLTSPEEAWGNAAIPGFGIGRPVRAPELDPAADCSRPCDARPRQSGSRQVFDIEPDLLVIASAPDAPLLVAWGSPGRGRRPAPGQRSSWASSGAVLAIVSAIVGAALLTTG